MKTLRTYVLVTALAAISAGQNSFGFVLPTFDIPGFAGTMAVLEQNVQQVAELGKLMGVATEQLNTVKDMKNSLGSFQLDVNLGDIGIDVGQISAAINAVEGFRDFDIRTLMRPDALGVFNGMSVDDWRETVSKPQIALSVGLRVEATERIGGQLGSSDLERDYAAWLARKSPKERESISSDVAYDLAGFSLEGYQKKTESDNVRRVAYQKQAEQLGEAATKAGTIEEKLAVANVIASKQLEVAVQNGAEQAKSNDTITKQLNAQIEEIKKGNEIMTESAGSQSMSSQMSNMME